MSKAAASKASSPVTLARKALLEGVGAELAASFPGITRLGGQIVAALFLADGPMTMDELVVVVERAKSNVFTNLRALEGAGIVRRQRETGARQDAYALAGQYPDVVVFAYAARLKRVLADKRALVARAREVLGASRGAEADALREKLDGLGKKYERYAGLFAELAPLLEGPSDLEGMLEALPAEAIRGVVTMVTRGAAKR